MISPKQNTTRKRKSLWEEALRNVVLDGPNVSRSETQPAVIRVRLCARVQESDSRHGFVGTTGRMRKRNMEEDRESTLIMKGRGLAEKP